MNEYVLKNFQFYHRTLADKMIDCHETKFGEMIIDLNDGRRVLYNDFDQSVRTLPTNNRMMTENEFDNEFAHRLRYIMLIRRITQKDISEETGIAQPVISRYVSGKTMPSMYNLHKLAQALDCSVDDLMYVE